MKKSIFSLALVLLMLLGSSLQTANAQTTRRVNNNPAAAAPFTTIQAAVNAAVAGDIILVEGSATTYDANNSPAEIRITKQLTITGPGYLFNVNNPVMQANALTAQVQAGVNIILATGSNGTVIQGLSGNGISARNYDASGNYYAVNNITVQRCQNVNVTTGINTASNSPTICSNWVFRNNNQGTAIFTLGSGHVVSNNIGCSLLAYGSSAIYQNNVVGGHATVSSQPYGSPTTTVFSNVTCQNNIYQGASSNSFSSCVPAPNTISFSNNLFQVSSFVVYTTTNCSTTGSQVNIAGNGNQFGLNMDNVMQLTVTPNSADGIYRLATGSPAIGAGVGGVDCGAFGGATPYRLSGIPAVPVITNMNATGAGNNTTPLNVVISVTGNQ